MKRFMWIGTGRSYGKTRLVKEDRLAEALAWYIEDQRKERRVSGQIFKINEKSSTTVEIAPLSEGRVRLNLLNKMSSSQVCLTIAAENAEQIAAALSGAAKDSLATPSST